LTTGSFLLYKLVSYCRFLIGFEREVSTYTDWRIEVSTTFKSGDWVTWAYKPCDPDGPYAYMLKSSFSRGDRDTIEDRLLRYLPPPYEVVGVFDTDPLFLKSVGHHQRVGVKMTLKPKWRNGVVDPVKIRHFSGMLFKKVLSPDSE